MRKKITILFLLLIALTSSGLTLNKHYCNGKLTNIFLFYHFGTGCDGSMPMNEDSCEDVYLGFILDTPLEYSTVSSTLIPQLSPALLTEVLLPIELTSLYSYALGLTFFVRPQSNIKIYVKIMSFLI